MVIITKKNNNIKKVEHFSGGSMLYFCLSMFAAYLSFKCNNGFELGDFLLATCCSPFYIAYRFAVDKDRCFPSMPHLSHMGSSTAPPPAVTYQAPPPGVSQ